MSTLARYTVLLFGATLSDGILQVEFVESLPMTATGKVIRRELRRQHIERFPEEAAAAKAAANA